jgi:hypothetical protein
MTPIVQGFFHLIGLIYMKPNYEILPHYGPQLLSSSRNPAGNDEEMQLPGGESRLEERKYEGFVKRPSHHQLYSFGNGWL